MRRLLVVAAACAGAAACATTLPAATALAHQGNPNFRSDVHGLEPATRGVTVEVLNRDDRLLLTNRSGRTIVIEGYSGDPYARLSPDGTVEVNHNSAAYYLTGARRRGARARRGAARPAAGLAHGVGTGRFEWHDHRMHWMGKGTPPAVKDESKQTKVDDWTVPIAVDGRSAQITGTLWWTPQPEGGAPVGAIAGLAALVVAGAAVVVVVRRRRRGAATATRRHPRRARCARRGDDAPAPSGDQRRPRGAGVALPGVVMAHAQLEGVTPQRGAVAEVAPDAVAFRFDEAVEGNFGAVRVFDARGERVDAGDAYHPGGRRADRGAPQAVAGRRDVHRDLPGCLRRRPHRQRRQRFSVGQAGRRGRDGGRPARGIGCRAGDGDRARRRARR